MNDVSVHSVAEDIVYMVYWVVILLWWFGKFCEECQSECKPSIPQVWVSFHYTN